MIGRVLIIAGSDSSGGAGIQADIKTATMLDGYAATAITALTAQNTLGVHGVYDVAPDFVAEQIKVVLDDVGADAIKIGMLATPEIIIAVADAIDAEIAKGVPLVLDPVMVAKGGARLLAENAIDALKSRLLPLAAIATPNLHEAKALTGISMDEKDQRVMAAREIQKMGVKSVLITGGTTEGGPTEGGPTEGGPTEGGTNEGDMLFDLLIDQNGDEKVFSHRRIETAHTHGTGCTLASAIATGLAQGMALEAAIARAHDFVQKAILAAPGFGGGHGPLGHAQARL